MAKATIKSKSGAAITVEGTEREVAKVVGVVGVLRRERKPKAPALQNLGESLCKGPFG